MKVNEVRRVETSSKKRKKNKSRTPELVQDLEKHQEEDIKDKKLELAEELDVASRVVKLHYIEDYQKEASLTFMLKNI